MLSDILNLRRLEPFLQIGRWAQLVGFACTVGPVAALLIPNRTHDPFGMLEQLPAYSPLVIADQYPGLIAVVTVPVGLALMVIGSRFLARAAWARSALQRACWAGSLFIAIYMLLTLLSATGVRDVTLLLFLGVCVLIAVIFGVALLLTAKRLDSPDILSRFDQLGSPE